MSLVVVKAGGASFAGAAGAILELARTHSVCVVHGAGPQISAALESRGLPVRFVRGRRVTDAAALEVVREALTEANAELCAAIGPLALPVPDGVLDAVRVPELGFVGDAVPSAPAVVVRALEANLIPVVAPLAQSDGSGPLNVNGDEAAVALALGLGAERIVFVTDVPGVLVDGGVASSLAAADAERLADGFDGGIVP